MLAFCNSRTLLNPDLHTSCIFLLWKGCCTTSSVQVIWSRHGWSYIAGTIKLLASVWDVKDLDKASIFDEVGISTAWKQPPVSGLHGGFPTLLCLKSQRPFSRLIFMHSLLQFTLNSLYSLVSPDWTIVKWKKIVVVGLVVLSHMNTLHITVNCKQCKRRHRGSCWRSTLKLVCFFSYGQDVKQG